MELEIRIDEKVAITEEQIAFFIRDLLDTCNNCLDIDEEIWVLIADSMDMTATWQLSPHKIPEWKEKVMPRIKETKEVCLISVIARYNDLGDSIHAGLDGIIRIAGVLAASKRGLTIPKEDGVKTIFAFIPSDLWKRIDAIKLQKMVVDFVGEYNAVFEIINDHGGGFHDPTSRFK